MPWGDGTVHGGSEEDGNAGGATASAAGLAAASVLDSYGGASLRKKKADARGRAKGNKTAT